MTNFAKISSVFVGAAVVGGLVGTAAYRMNAEPMAAQDLVTDAASPATATPSAAPTTAATSTPIAFLYQTVGRMGNGVGENAVALGTSVDGKTVSSLGANGLTWNIRVDKTEKYHYGDPVFSRLADGTWTMTSWSGPSDPRGAAFMLYHESSCPVVNDDAVIAIGPSSAAGCAKVGGLTMAKTSQVFDGPEGHYVFHMAGGEIYLARLSDATHSAKDLDSMCVLSKPVTSVSELDYGESTKVIGGTAAQSMLLSDAAIARRADGTWVMFIKGIKKDSGCTSGGSICELCARNIFRTTSSDLIAWSALEKVVEQASVPEATTMPDGTVRLYFQDFDDACAAQNQQVAGIAPVSFVSETPGTYAMSEPQQTTYPDEAFQSDDKMHFATNGNPVRFPDAKAYADFLECAK